MPNLIPEVAVFLSTDRGIALFQDPNDFDWGPLRTSQLGVTSEDTVLTMLGDLGISEVELPHIHNMSSAPKGLVCCVEYPCSSGGLKMSLVFLVCVGYDLGLSGVRYVQSMADAPRSMLPAMAEALLVTLQARSKVYG